MKLEGKSVFLAKVKCFLYRSCKIYSAGHIDQYDTIFSSKVAIIFYSGNETFYNFDRLYIP